MYSQINNQSMCCCGRTKPEPGEHNATRIGRQRGERVEHQIRRRENQAMERLDGTAPDTAAVNVSVKVERVMPVS